MFGERLQKRIMEDEQEEKKHKALLKLNVETKTKDIPKNNVVENDKENGSQFSINSNESNIEQRSTSGIIKINLIFLCDYMHHVNLYIESQNKFFKFLSSITTFYLA